MLSFQFRRKTDRKCLHIERKSFIIVHVRQSTQALRKGSEGMNEMTTAELNQYLENIAKLIEATAKDTEAAAKIVRDSKVKA